ncbi:MAG: class I SAM-dependent methyltransferase [Ruminococcaceae bacterium]|nr:class I SAM-dependent methyltransferase [Oscillospiraceae bacterium]
MSEYGILAGCYDEFTRDIDYGSFADFYEQIFALENIEVKSMLDLACGTGTLTCLLADRGYELIGVDRSIEMLSEAFDKAQNVRGIRPLFLNQDMTKLDLYGTVDCAVCCLDGINYLSDPEDAAKTFERLKFFINPNGLFIFDINSAYKLKNLDGGMFIDEDENSYCVWRTEFNEETNLCFYGMDIFKKQKNELWKRGFEEHYEYAYTPEQLKQLLEANGFHDVKFYADRKNEAPKEDELRIFITARRDNY